MVKSLQWCGCHWKSAHSHLDEKGHFLLAKLPSVAVLPVSAEPKVLGRGNAYRISFKNSLSICVTFCFCSLMSVTYFGTSQHLWVFGFPSHWKSRLHNTWLMCPSDILYQEEYFAVPHTRLLAIMPLQCNPVFSTVCSSSSCKFICAQISEILFITNVSAVVSKAESVTLHRVLWIPQHCLNLASCPKETLHSSYSSKLNGKILAFCAQLGLGTDIPCVHLWLNTQRRATFVWRLCTLVARRSSSAITISCKLCEPYSVAFYDV